MSSKFRKPTKTKGSGVPITDQQKEQIQTLWKEGKNQGVRSGLLTKRIQETIGCSLVSIYCYNEGSEKTKKDSLRKKQNNNKNIFKHKLGKQLYKFKQKLTKDGVISIPFTVKDLLDKFGQNTYCFLTGESLDLSVWIENKSYSFDHIIPLGRGGSNSLDNLGITTRQSNISKGDLLYEQYVKFAIEILKYNGQYTITALNSNGIDILSVDITNIPRNNRHPKIPTKKQHKIFSCRNDGRTLKEKAKVFNCTDMTIYRYSKEPEEQLSYIQAEKCRGFKLKTIGFNFQDVLDKFPDFRCCLTGVSIDPLQPDTYEFDHMIPRSKGGNNSLDNLQLVTTTANLIKNDNAPKELLELLEKVVRHNGNFEIISPFS